MQFAYLYNRRFLGFSGRSPQLLLCLRPSPSLGLNRIGDIVVVIALRLFIDAVVV
jgi:hypothetical protein